MPWWNLGSRFRIFGGGSQVSWLFVFVFFIFIYYYFFMLGLNTLVHKKSIVFEFVLRKCMSKCFLGLAFVSVFGFVQACLTLLSEA